jgi:mannose-6-phosphate isomerase-like protein (cupin superfamily)
MQSTRHEYRHRPERTKGVVVDTTTRQIENRLSKEIITFLRTGAETDGELFAFEVRVPTDMVPPPPHLHIAEEERLKVLEGEMTVQTDGRRRVLRPGESHVVKPGAAHTWHNSGRGPLRFSGEFRPAGNAQSFFETYCGLAAEGRSDEKGQPPLLQVAASLPLWGMYLAGPPIPAQRLLMAVLRPLARLRGYRPRYERFERG